MTTTQEIDELITCFMDYMECDEYHIHDGTGEHEGSTPNNQHRDFNEEKFKQALSALIEERERHSATMELFKLSQLMYCPKNIIKYCEERIATLRSEEDKS